MSNKIYNISFKRNGELVNASVSFHNDLLSADRHIRRSNGLTLYGVNGYLSRDGKTIHSYFGHLIASDVKGLEHINKINLK